MSTGYKSIHSGFLDVSRSNGLRLSSGWIKLDWPTVMLDNYLHQHVSGSLPSYSWQLNVGEH